MQFTVVIPFKPSNELKNDIDKGLKLLTTRYNTEAKKLKKRYDFWKNTKAYKIAEKEGIDSVSKFWEERSFNGEYGIDKLFKINNFKTHTKPKKNIYKNTIVNASMLQKLRANLWRSVDKLIKGKGKNIRYVTMQTIPFKSLSGIKWNQKDSVFSFTHKRGHVITQHIDVKTPYELHAFNNCDMRMVTIKKEIIRGKEKYFFHICFEGTPYNKGRALGTASVGIDPSLENMYA